MAAWGVTAGCVVLAVGAMACAGADGDAVATTLAPRVTSSTSTIAPPRPTSPTTTIYDPATVEGQVEAAYLRSWDVYADAVYNLHLDEAALQSVYAERSLENKRTEIRGRIASRRAALVRVEHRYDIVMVDPNSAHLIDRFVNHQVLIDASTKAPIEPDPDERLVFNFELSRSDIGWRVTRIERVRL